VHGRPILIH